MVMVELYEMNRVISLKLSKKKVEELNIRVKGLTKKQILNRFYKTFLDVNYPNNCLHQMYEILLKSKNLAREEALKKNIHYLTNKIYVP